MFKKKAGRKKVSPKKRGRPPNAFNRQCAEVVEAVRARLTEKEQQIFQYSEALVQTLFMKSLRHGHSLSKEQRIADFVNQIKSGPTKKVYAYAQLMGISRNEYYKLVSCIKKDAASDHSLLDSQKYSIVAYYKDRYTLKNQRPILKAGCTDNGGVTFSMLEDLVKIRIHHFDALKEKFEKRKKVFRLPHR